ncbi:hypothetical protein ACFWIY_29320, partial [Streptomyces sioyaensis]|uniref:hypothetical protein n=1 Tax=Streptomyces sioyaensis TaxID=67364 RepID=UPI003668AFE3
VPQPNSQRSGNQPAAGATANNTHGGPADNVRPRRKAQRRQTTTAGKPTTWGESQALSAR